MEMEMENRNFKRAGGKAMEYIPGQAVSRVAEYEVDDHAGGGGEFREGTEFAVVYYRDKINKKHHFCAIFCVLREGLVPQPAPEDTANPLQRNGKGWWATRLFSVQDWPCQGIAGGYSRCFLCHAFQLGANRRAERRQRRPAQTSPDCPDCPDQPSPGHDQELSSDRLAATTVTQPRS